MVNHFELLYASSRRRGRCPAWGTATRALMQEVYLFQLHCAGINDVIGCGSHLAYASGIRPTVKCYDIGVM